MAHHAQLSDEAAQALNRQKRNSTISAIIISLLVCALLVSILFLIVLNPFFKNQEELVTYSSTSESVETITEPEMTDQVQKKPSPPSSAMSKVITSNTASPTAVPVPEITITEPSLDFGDSNDFGDGWGSGGSNGGGAGGGAATFFEQEIKAERIAYVIDYSASMRGKKFELMKKELAKSIKNLPDGVEYQLIFFAGPTWIASDTIVEDRNIKNVTITREGKAYNWKGRKSSPKLPEAQWLTSNKDQRKESLKFIKDTPLIYGTIWNIPIDYALDMSPQPDVIFFMTDGTAGKNTNEIAKEIGKVAKRKKVVINCVALMEPRAKEAMADIAKQTGGIFTEVQANGRTIQHDLK